MKYRPQIIMNKTSHSSINMLLVITDETPHNLFNFNISDMSE